MFEKRSDRGYRPALDGIERKTLVHGQKTLMTEFRLRKGAVLPRHSHPHEQTGYLVKGRIRLLIGTEEYEAQVGDSWCIPGGVEHGADILEDSVAIEVFSPVRDDYVPGRVLRLRRFCSLPGMDMKLPPALFVALLGFALSSHSYAQTDTARRLPAASASREGVEAHLAG